MNTREEALQAALRQIDKISWERAAAEEPDIGTELVLYLMEKDGARREALDCICTMLAGYAGQPNHMGDVYKIADAARA